MILITGAGGKTGRAVLAALRDRGVAVRCFVRRQEVGESLRALGASEITLGSMADDETLATALQGCSAVYHIAPNVDSGEETYAAVLLRQARAAGIQRLVYHSVLHPQIEAMPHHWAKMRVEEMILASGLPFTILRPTAYMQNILAAVPRARSEGCFVTPYPVTTRISLVDLQDVAEVAGKVLTEAGHDFAIYDLVGTPPIDQVDVAEVLSRVLARPVVAQEQAIADWDAQAAAAGVGEVARSLLRRMFIAYATQGLPGNSFVLQALLGRRPTSLEAMLRRSLP